MTVKVSRPLPECRDCQRPTRRKAHTANLGRCTDCHEAHASAQTAIDVPYLRIVRD